MKKTFILLTFVVTAILFMSQNISSSKANMILANIEVLTDTEDPTKTRSCYMDKDVIEDLSAASKYTICNSETTSSTMYKCGKDKQGKFEGYSTPTSYKCMY